MCKPQVNVVYCVLTPPMSSPQLTITDKTILLDQCTVLPSVIIRKIWYWDPLRLVTS